MNSPHDDKKREALAIPGVESLVVPELLEAFRREGGHLEINVLLHQVVSKAPSSEESVEQAERLLELVQKFEKNRVANFVSMSDAVISVKDRDPDEQEKRRNNRLRRWLRGCIIGCTAISLIAATFCVIHRAEMVVTALVIGFACMGLAMTGVLASGESISSNDVVRIFGAMADVFPWKNKEEAARQRPNEHQGPSPSSGSSRRSRK